METTACGEADPNAHTLLVHTHPVASAGPKVAKSPDMAGEHATATPGALPKTVPTKARLDDFELEKVVGRGAYGKVLLVRLKGTERRFAMKVIEKAFLAKPSLAAYMKTERDVMARLNHPFLVRLSMAF